MNDTPHSLRRANRSTWIVGALAALFILFFGNFAYSAVKDNRTADRAAAAASVAQSAAQAAAAAAAQEKADSQCFNSQLTARANIADQDSRITTAYRASQKRVTNALATDLAIFGSVKATPEQRTIAFQDLQDTTNRENILQASLDAESAANATQRAAHPLKIEC